VEVLLAKTGRVHLEIDEICQSLLLKALQDWLYCRLLRTDSSCLGEPFGNEFTNYMQELPWDTLTQGDAVLDQVWCRPGRTGIIVLLVGLYWQAEYSGGGNLWDDNIWRVDKIFCAILDAPTL
jgi:hypothetical protein